MNAGDSSLVGGLITAVTLIGLNFLVSPMTHHCKTLEAIIEGRSLILVHDIKLFEDVMAKAKLPHHGLNAARCSSIAEVHSAILGKNGAMALVSVKEKTW